MSHMSHMELPSSTWSQLVYEHCCHTVAHLAWKKGVCRKWAFFDVTFQQKNTFFLNTFPAGVSYSEIGLKSSIFRLSHQPHSSSIDYCSSPQKTQQIFESAMKQNFSFWVLFFCE